MARQSVLAGFLLGLLVATPAAARTEERSACTADALPDIGLPNGYPFDIHRMVTLYRFHRRSEALSELDAARAIVRGPWRWRLRSALRTELASRLDKLRDCLVATKPPQLAKLAVRVVGDAPERAVSRPRAGVRVHVDGILIGHTGTTGRLVARVPSGRIYVEAEDPISEWNAVDVNLEPGQAKSIRIALSDGKEVSERTKLTLVEAIDDIVPKTSGSFTLRFMRNDRVAPVTTIDEIDVIGPEGNIQADLRGHFRVVGGEIVTTDSPRLFEALAPYLEDTIRLRVQAMFSSDELHYGRIAFRVAQSPLTVSLAAPPSNPALDVSDIEVWVAAFDGIGVQRVSDGRGRVHLESFPHGNVALECAVESGGRYYYGNATLTHTGRRAVTLVLRHVDDLKKGVAPLRVDAPNGEP